jgi:hypothetical protein
VAIASTSGGNYEDLDTTDTATVTINDTIDVSNLTINEVLMHDIGGNPYYEYTATLTEDDGITPVNVQDTMVITLNNGLILTIASGNTATAETTALTDATIQATGVTSIDTGTAVFEDLNVNFALGENAILTNELGNTLSGVDMNINFDDASVSTVVLTPQVNTDGFAVSADGALLHSTSGGVTYNLVYVTDPLTGVVTAYQADPVTHLSNGAAVFTLTPDAATGTYSITLDATNQLDGAAWEAIIDWDSGSVVDTGGNAADGYLIFEIADADGAGDILTVTAYAKEGGATVPLNYNPSNGLGVSNSTISDTQTITLVLDHSISTETTFDLGQYDPASAYDKPEITLSYQGTAIADADYDVVIDASGHVTFVSYLPNNEEVIFDEIVFLNDNGSGKNIGFALSAMSAVVTESGEGNVHTINVDVEATDSDGDLASGVMQVTFDNDGTIIGTDNDETIDYTPSDAIDAGGGFDTLLLGTGEDLDFSAVTNGQLQNIEKIDLSENGDHAITNLTAEDVFHMTDSASNMLFIDRDSTSDTVGLDSSLTSTGSTYTDPGSGQVYDVYTGTYDDGTTVYTVTLNIEVDPS